MSMAAEFTQFQLPKMKLSKTANSIYRVYKDKTEFVEIEAATASEALEKSGNATPYKIMHYRPEIYDYFDESMLVRYEAAVSEVKLSGPKTPPEVPNNDPKPPEEVPVEEPVEVPSDPNEVPNVPQETPQA